MRQIHFINSEDVSGIFSAEIAAQNGVRQGLRIVYNKLKKHKEAINQDLWLLLEEFYNDELIKAHNKRQKLHEVLKTWKSKDMQKKYQRLN